MTCAAALAAAVDAGRVLAERDRILADREFNPPLDWRARLFEWLGDRLSDFVSLLAPGLKPVLIVLLVLAVLATVWMLLPSRGGGGGPGGRVAPSTAPVRAPGLVELRNEAQAALAAGRLAEAIRFSWLAAVALLDRTGLSVARAARADWEHVTAAGRQRPQLHEPLSSLALAFQRTHFGKTTPGRAEAEGCLGLLARLERELGG
jgi:hypothetical protein